MKRYRVEIILGLVFVAILLAWIGSFMNFAIVQVMTAGGPANSSEVFASPILCPPSGRRASNMVTVLKLVPSFSTLTSFSGSVWNQPPFSPAGSRPWPPRTSS